MTEQFGIEEVKLILMYMGENKHYSRSGILHMTKDMVLNINKIQVQSSIEGCYMHMYIYIYGTTSIADKVGIIILIFLIFSIFN